MTKKIFAFVLVFTFTTTSFSQTLLNGFQNPPNDARIMMRWWWFGSAVTKPEIEKELRTMRDGGIGGVEVQPVYPLLPDDEKAGIKNLPYLSDEFIDALRFTGVKTKELGLRMDLTLGSGWSFGGAKTPITEAAGQLRVERVKIDKDTRRIPIPSMIPAEKFHGAFLLTSDKSWQELTNIKDDNLFLTPEDAKKGN
ncbi:MAG TPA: glycosyl hydrolase, partial [Pyrinomonadaceae bacterium]|nr:glycosyl hydrolase [Pyrinomonadaceae bacterium]